MIQEIASRDSDTDTTDSLTNVTVRTRVLENTQRTYFSTSLLVHKLQSLFFLVIRSQVWHDGYV